MSNKKSLYNKLHNYFRMLGTINRLLVKHKDKDVDVCTVLSALGDICQGC